MLVNENGKLRYLSADTGIGYDFYQGKILSGEETNKVLIVADKTSGVSGQTNRIAGWLDGAQGLIQKEEDVIADVTSIIKTYEREKSLFATAKYVTKKINETALRKGINFEFIERFSSLDEYLKYTNSAFGKEYHSYADTKNLYGENAFIYKKHIYVITNKEYVNDLFGTLPMASSL